MASLLRHTFPSRFAFCAPSPDWVYAGARARGVLIASIAQCLLAASAHATCGDWLAHPTGNAAAGTSFGGGSEPASQPAHAQTESSAPCRGPECERAPATPAAPQAPVEVSVVRDHLAVLVRSAGSANAQSSFSLAVSFGATPRPGFYHRIEHPPRT
jgi:hypothetical protein